MKYEIKVKWIILIKFWCVHWLYTLSVQLYCTWNNLSKLWIECNKKLDESLQMALHYQDTMQVCAHSVNNCIPINKHLFAIWPPTHVLLKTKLLFCCCLMPGKVQTLSPPCSFSSPKLYCTKSQKRQFEMYPAAYCIRNRVARLALLVSAAECDWTFRSDAHTVLSCS